MERSRTERFLVLLPISLVGGHLLLCFLYNWRTPFGNNGYANTPDEGAHFAYVQYVARTWRLPVFRGYEGIGYEAHQPPLYYFSAAGFYRLVQSVSESGKWVRGVSTLFSALTVLLAWLIARRLRPDSLAWAVSVTAFVAFLPMQIAMGSAVGNDTLLTFLFTLCLWLLLNMLENPSTKRSVSIGLCIGAGMLTKTTAILLVPVALVAMWRLVRQGNHPLREIGKWTATCLLGSALVGGWWFVRNALLYHDPLLQKTFQQAFAGTAKASDFFAAGVTPSEYLLWVGNWTFRSFWFAYGTPATAATGKPNFLPEAVYWVLGFWQLGVLVGLLLRLQAPLAPLLGEWLRIALLALLLVALTFIAFITVFFQAQGRYFFPVLMPIAVLNALGWEGLFPTRFRSWAHGGLAGGGFTFAFWTWLTALA